MDAEPPYDIEFYEDENGREPVRDWIVKKLTAAQRGALVLAIEQVLAYEGLDVVQSEFGDHTTQSGVYEFRLRQDENQLASRIEARKRARGAAPAAAEEDENGREPEAAPPRASGQKVFLRVFFHVHGDKVVLLLAGYDKNRDPSPRHENKAIQTAAKRLKAWRIEQSKAAKARRRSR